LYVEHVAEVIQLENPDVITMMEVDYDEQQNACKYFRENYLMKPFNGAKPVDYPYCIQFASNTGEPSGVDLDNKHGVGGAGDAFGWGEFPGKYAFMLLSKLKPKQLAMRTFKNFLAADMPGVGMAATSWPTNEDGSQYYS
jgi:hypothetical protein